MGVIIDGCPAGIALSPHDFSDNLARRRSGAPGTTGRREMDTPQISSGVYRGRTTGAPIHISFQNTDARSEDYTQLKGFPRPGHADLTTRQKYGGFNDPRGGGHFSGRLTVGLVAAGTIAGKVIAPMVTVAELIEAGGGEDISAEVKKAMENGDSIGGIVRCVVSSLPAGLGEPFFDSVESTIAHVIFSIPGVKAIEFGAGFRAACMAGTAHNDLIMNEAGLTETNNSGGINGGITNGNDLTFRVCIKPTPSVSTSQKTFCSGTGKMEELKIPGRHDTCIALRCPVIVEAATAIALADLMLCSRATIHRAIFPTDQQSLLPPSEG